MADDMARRRGPDRRRRGRPRQSAPLRRGHRGHTASMRASGSASISFSTSISPGASPALPRPSIRAWYRGRSRPGWADARAAARRRCTRSHRDDSRAIAALKELQAVAGSRLALVEADALKIDLATLGPPPRRIVANLPYNVSTALLVGWLHQADQVCDMVLMFQKEVADRLAAQPRSKDYGRLSVLAQHVCTVQRLFDVAPSAFVPPPKVVPRWCGCGPRSAGRMADCGPWRG